MYFSPHVRLLACSDCFLDTFSVFNFSEPSKVIIIIVVDFMFVGINIF